MNWIVGYFFVRRARGPYELSKALSSPSALIKLLIGEFSGDSWPRVHRGHMPRAESCSLSYGNTIYWDYEGSILRYSNP